MANILIVNRIFTHYRRDVMNVLHKDVDFVFIHAKNNSGIKQVEASYSREIPGLQYSSKETSQFLNVFPYIIKNRPKVIIHEFALGTSSLIPSFILARILGIKFIVWGHGYDRSKGFDPSKSLLDKIRLFLLKKTDATLLYGEKAKEELAQYINKEKMFVAHNCLNTLELSKLREKFERTGRGKLKQNLNFSHQYNLTFIGRLTKSKKTHVLIDVFEHLSPNIREDLCLHIIGSGDDLESMINHVDAKGYQGNFKFHGAVYSAERTGEILYCSDLMIIPGAVGLSLNHAFNFDCPVITYKRGENGPFHAPESENLIHNETGYLVEKHHPRELAKTIEEHLSDEKTRIKMRQSIRYRVENVCSVQNFVEGFKRAINFVTFSEGRQ